MPITPNTSKRLRALLPATLVIGVLLAQAMPALACGGLVAPNGAIRLDRATTLVAWHDGVEQYLTSFTYQGDVSDLGWIVPLPAVPTKIQEGGAWTLQRLERETHPQPLFAAEANGAAQAASAQVLQQVQIEALDITVLKGDGREVLAWCAQNGFALDVETRDHLLGYAQGSPIFMAAKYDTSRAKARGQLQGDGAPVLITMPTKQIWVPLEVLALEGQQVQADLYLLTDMPVNTSSVGSVLGQSPVGTQIPGAPGFSVAFQEPMNASLYHDLSTDRNMGWVRPDGWLTYLQLNAPDTAVTYDLGVSTTGVLHVAPFGSKPDAVAESPQAHDLPAWLPRLPIGTPQTILAALLFLAVTAGLVLFVRRSLYPRRPPLATPSALGDAPTDA
jgi:hypothetical protein